MNYISVNKFLEQPKEIQEVFKNWWQPSKGDIYCNVYNNQQDNVFIINSCQLEMSGFKNDIKQFGFPLLVEGQLRGFIQDKTKCKLDILCCEYNYIIGLYDKNDFECIEQFTINKTDLLQAYWQVACEIAKLELEEQK